MPGSPLLLFFPFPSSSFCISALPQSSMSHHNPLSLLPPPFLASTLSPTLPPLSLFLCLALFFRDACRFPLIRISPHLSPLFPPFSPIYLCSHSYFLMTYILPTLLVHLLSQTSLVSLPVCSLLLCFCSLMSSASLLLIISWLRLSMFQG